jgi:hypothetical protein
MLLGSRVRPYVSPCLKPPAYHTTSSTVRRAIDIGAQRENREHFHSSLLEDQLRKRAFWTLYSFDREWRHR